MAGLVFGCMMTAFADTEVVDGVEWRYRVINGKVSLGMGGDYLSGTRAVPTTTTGRLVIPEKLGSLDVVEIGPYAFYDVGGITEVVIPDSVTNICDSAFYADNYLSNVVLSASSRLEIIGEYAFASSISLISIDLPRSLKRIGCCAFNTCSSLRRIELPQSITSIEDETFSQSGLRTIPANAFRECVKLESVTIPASVTNIGCFAFRDCLGLWNVTFKGFVPSKEPGAFMGVPAFTALSSRVGSASAIIYAEVTNSTDRIDVPKVWLDELAVKFDPPAGFASYQEAFESRFGADFVAALTKMTGKHDLAGNKMKVWQDYVAGTNPLDGEDVFKAMIVFEDGIPVVKWSPKLTVQQEALRNYKVFGATILKGVWTDVSDMSDAERYAAGYQFYKVSVEMR